MHHRQGLLYSERGYYKCPQHEAIERKYEDMVDEATTDPDSDAARKLDPAHCREKSMDMAEQYSQHPFGSLLILCFERLKNDCLAGYKDAPTDTPYPTAVALLKHTVDNMNAAVQKNMAIHLDFGALGVSPEDLARCKAAIQRSAGHKAVRR
tara:strand:+ start:4964 stop:5419 length:456 start_codon:yes stop_codon:yes gene_type:complete